MSLIVSVSLKTFYNIIISLLRDCTSVTRVTHITRVNRLRNVRKPAYAISIGKSYFAGWCIHYSFFRILLMSVFFSHFHKMNNITSQYLRGCPRITHVTRVSS